MFQGGFIMNTNEKTFKQAERWTCRYDDSNQIQLRLISDDVVMYANLDVEEMKNLRYFIDRQIERAEHFQSEEP
jgi:hypothetical protein